MYLFRPVAEGLADVVVVGEVVAAVLASNHRPGRGFAETARDRPIVGCHLLESGLHRVRLHLVTGQLHRVRCLR